MNLEAASDRGRSALSSERDSFEALFRAEYNRVAGIANRVLGDAHEAEDVAQEVFIDFHRLHSARAQYAAAWLYRASAHTALNRVRGRRRREKREQAVSTQDEPGQALDPQRIAEANEERRRLRSALARLPRKPAAVLVLRSSGLSYAEVAEAVGVSTGQIGTLLRRAEAALRKEVNRESPE